MTQQSANITVTAQLANGKGTYWARAAYQVIPKGPGQFLFQPTSFEILYEIDSDLEALTKGLAVSPFPQPPNGVRNHLELEDIVWKTENVHDESKVALTPEGAQRVKGYVLQNYAKLFPQKTAPAPVSYSPGTVSLN